MPKLNFLDILGRLDERIRQLDRGDAVEARDLNTVLTEEQQQQLKDAWQAQRDIRTRFTTKKAAEQAGLEWKTIREVRLDVLRQALERAYANFEDDYKEYQRKQKVRAARIYMDAYCATLDANEANNSNRDPDAEGNIALARAGFKVHRQNTMSQRDREVREMEDELRRRFRAEMTPFELEQLEILEEHERSLRKTRK